MAGFSKCFYPSISKSLHTYFNPLQIASLILILNGLVMIANERSIA